MKDVDSKNCQVHVLICTNKRDSSEKPCCYHVGGEDFYFKLKKKIKEAGLYNTHWSTKTGCLGFCNPVGTTATIYRKQPDGKWGDPEWYNEITENDFETLWKEITR